MTMLRAILFVVVSFLLVNTSASAQTPKDSAYISLPDVQVQQGSIITIPVKISAFDKFLSTQFTMQWDSTKLQYLSVGDFGLSKMTLSEHFNTSVASSGKLAFVWYDTSIQGIPAENNKTIFTVKFKAIGNNVTVPLLFIDNPAGIEVSNFNNNPMKIGLKNGNVTIGKVSASSDIDLFTTKIYDIFPNPLGGQNAQIRLDIAQNTDVNIEIFDFTGKNILYINNFYNIGTHFVEIGRNQFPQMGAYTYRVTTNLGETLSGKLIVN